MTDREIIKGVRKYFKIHELVGKRTYKKFGDNAWKFIDFRLLLALLIIRENLGKGITVNNWFWGGKFSQRGLRTNVQQIFKNFFKKRKLYLSGHILGKAVDFDVKGMTAREVRDWILKYEDLFPFKIRLEDGVNWTHLDVVQDFTKSKIYLFSV